MSDVEPLVQLRGSLEELSLCGSRDDYGNPSVGLRRFPESFLALTKLQELGLDFHFRIKAIPAGISNLKKLQCLSVAGCDLRSLPKELGALKQLEVLDISWNKALGAAPDDVAFPKELKGMKSLRELNLRNCGLRRVPAFVRELSSLEEICLGNNPDLQIDAPLDYLIECCPRLRVVKMKKVPGGRGLSSRWRTSGASRLKLLAKNPSAEVEFLGV